MQGWGNDRGSWCRGVASTVGGAALGFFVVGCPQPADLDDSWRGTNAAAGTSGSGGTGGSGGAGAAGAAGASCESACITRIFTSDSKTQCKLCHDANTAARPSLGQLDLSIGFTARLKNVNAKHVQIDPTTYPNPMCANGDLLIDTQNPAESWLWKKVNRMAGTCGDPMPVGAPLSADNLSCVKTYIECVADRRPIVATGGASGGGGGSGGSAGSGVSGGGSAGSGVSGGGSAGSGGT